MVSFSSSECFSCRRLPGSLAWRARVKSRAEHLVRDRGALQARGWCNLQVAWTAWLPGASLAGLSSLGNAVRAPESTGVALQEAAGGPCQTGWMPFTGLILGKNDTGQIIAVSMSQGLLLCTGLVMRVTIGFSVDELPPCRPPSLHQTNDASLKCERFIVSLGKF